MSAQKYTAWFLGAFLLVLASSAAWASEVRVECDASDGGKTVHLLFTPAQVEALETGSATLASCGYGKCTFNSDCCGGDCHFGQCRGDSGCGYGKCTFNSDCCGGDCHFGQCRGDSGCGYGKCTFNSDCCGGDCHFGQCRGSQVVPN